MIWRSGPVVNRSKTTKDHWSSPNWFQSSLLAMQIYQDRSQSQSLLAGAKNRTRPDFQTLQINHQAQDTPSVSYLRTHSTVPPITPSHAKPMVDQVWSNVNTTLLLCWVCFTVKSAKVQRCFTLWWYLTSLQQRRGFIGILKPTTFWGYAGNIHTRHRWNSSMKETWKNFFDVLMTETFITQQRWESSHGVNLDTWVELSTDQSIFRLLLLHWEFCVKITSPYL